MSRQKNGQFVFKPTNTVAPAPAPVKKSKAAAAQPPPPSRPKRTTIKAIGAKNTGAKKKAKKEESSSSSSDEVEEEEKAPAAQPPGLSPQAFPKRVEKAAQPPSRLVALQSDLNLIIRSALAPLKSLVGMVAARLRYNDASVLFAYKGDSPDLDDRLNVVEAADTLEEFLERNKELGLEFLRTYITEEGLAPSRATLTNPMRVGAHQLLDYSVEPMLPDLLADPNYTLEVQIRRIEELIEVARAERPPPQDTYADQIAELMAALSETDDPIEKNALRAQITGLQIRAITEPPLEGFPTNLALLYEKLEELKRAQYERGVRSVYQSELRRKYAPVWAFETMGTALIQKVLSTTCWGAFEAALSKINRIQNCERFTMKELISSPSVHDMFAFMVSHEYLSSGDQLQQNDGGKQYLNIVKLRAALAEQMRQCRITFELFVRKRGNSQRLQFLKEFKEQRANMSPEDIATYEAYAEMMPKTELVYTG